MIEIDGASHDTENARDRDQKRTEILQSYGLNVIRFKNHEVLHHFTDVVAFMEGVIPPSPP